MGNELAVNGQPMELTTTELENRRLKIYAVMKSIMREGVDFGVIPGVKKPSLFKSGAEKLLSTFMLSANPIVEDLSGPDEKRYRVSVDIVHQVTGVFLGRGIGEASTGEEKFKWRAAVCQEEFDLTDPERRRIAFKKYQGQVQKVQQVRTNPSDLANTVLKMGKKRGLVDGTLTVTAASDIFTQDVEDLPQEYVNPGDKPASASHQPVERKSTGTAKPQENASQAPQGGGKSVTGTIKYYNEPKGASKFHSFVLAEHEGLYLATKDPGIVETLRDHKTKGTTVEITYTTEVNGKYTNNYIVEIATQAAAKPADSPAYEPGADDLV